MKRKIVAGFVLLAFCVFDWSCTIYTKKKFPVSELTPDKAGIFPVAGLITKSKEKITLPEEYPGFIHGNRLYFLKKINRAVTIELKQSEFMEYIQDASGAYRILVDSEGRFYWISKLLKSEDIIILTYIPDVVSFSLSDIAYLLTRKANDALTFIVLIAIGGIVLLLVMMDPPNFSNYSIFGNAVKKK